MKRCNKCGIEKLLDKFNKNKNKKDGRQAYCRECSKKYNKNYYHNYGRKEVYKDWYENHGGREKQGSISLYKNKSCSSYLGVAVNERLIKHLFPDAEMMSMHNPGYDFICNKNKKGDAKGSTTHIMQNKNSSTEFWSFCIRKNKIADFFLCIAYDSIFDLNPIHIWMLPREEANNQLSIQISVTTLHKWDQWKMDIDKAQSCCTAIKEK